MTKNQLDQVKYKDSTLSTFGGKTYHDKVNQKFDLIPFLAGKKVKHPERLPGICLKKCITFFNKEVSGQDLFLSSVLAISPL